MRRRHSKGNTANMNLREGQDRSKGCSKKSVKKAPKAVWWEQAQQMCFKLAWPEECSPWKRPDTVTLGLATRSPRGTLFCGLPSSLSLSAFPKPRHNELAGCFRLLESDQNSRNASALTPRNAHWKLAQLPSALLRAPVHPSLAKAWHSANDHHFFLRLLHSGSAPLPLSLPALTGWPWHSNCIACIHHLSPFTPRS